MQQRENQSLQIEDHLPQEYHCIVELVQPRSKVLDLGCGTGVLLKTLQMEKHVRAQGIELNEEAIQACVGKGLFVYHGDLDEGLADFNDKSVDYVIATNTLQVLHRPAVLIKEMARVGKQCIISVPNFAYWRIRMALAFKGTMPKSGQIPYEWYDSPNIHHTTIEDFRRFCRQHNITIRREIGLRHMPDNTCKEVKHFKNMLSDYAVFLVQEG